ncbi:hypothetical protein Fmac_020843 [Flemingia macrophylla]|uniref:Ubiquitin-like domain-containing protein n=1 Tax=Flemingia macrophylla TaxID=520843 RepID=A0ABD1LV91_9FABA
MNHSRPINSSIKVTGSGKPYFWVGFSCRVKGLSPNPIGSSIYMRKVDLPDGVTVVGSEKVKDELVLEGNDIELVSRFCALSLTRYCIFIFVFPPPLASTSPIFVFLPSFAPISPSSAPIAHFLHLGPLFLPLKKLSFPPLKTANPIVEMRGYARRMRRSVQNDLQLHQIKGTQGVHRRSQEALWLYLLFNLGRLSGEDMLLVREEFNYGVQEQDEICEKRVVRMKEWWDFILTLKNDVRSLRNVAFMEMMGERETMVDYDARLTGWQNGTITVLDWMM